MIQLSEFFSNTHSCSFWNGSVWLELAESATGGVVLLQLLSKRDGAVGVTNLDAMCYRLKTSFKYTFDILVNKCTNKEKYSCQYKAICLRVQAV